MSESHAPLVQPDRMVLLICLQILLIHMIALVKNHFGFSIKLLLYQTINEARVVEGMGLEGGTPCKPWHIDNCSHMLRYVLYIYICVNNSAQYTSIYKYIYTHIYIYMYTVLIQYMYIA